MNHTIFYNSLSILLKNWIVKLFRGGYIFKNNNNKIDVLFYWASRQSEWKNWYRLFYLLYYTLYKPRLKHSITDKLNKM